MVRKNTAKKNTGKIKIFVLYLMNCVIEKEIFWCSSPQQPCILHVTLCFQIYPRGVGKPCCCSDTTRRQRCLTTEFEPIFYILPPLFNLSTHFPFLEKIPYCLLIAMFSSVQSLSHVQLFATPWTSARQASLSITNPWSLLRLMSIETVMPSNHLILCNPLLLPPSIFPSIGVFSNESVLHNRLPEDWSFSFSISPSSEYSGLISFRMDWLDLLAVQETLKSLLQHHSSKASILQCSAFFIVQLSHPYMTTGKP